MDPNPQQQKVIDHIDGPCLVTAVPGSGKTASLTERIKNLIQKGVPPNQILAITFTNKAAKEMRKRIAEAVGDAADDVTTSTFHSFCCRILREHADKVGLTHDFSIYDDEDKARLIKTCIHKIEDVKDADGNVVKEYEPTTQYLEEIGRYIEGRRNGCLSHVEAVVKFGVDANQVNVIKEYFRGLKLCNAIDFTGLLSEVVRLFELYPEVLEYYQDKYKYISVDEVQDTNVSQYTIIKQLAMKHRNILMVGDLDQSIYRFRHAAPENLLQFEKDFSTGLLKLEINYRSTPQILMYAQNLIERNKFRKATKLQTNNGNGDHPVIIGSDSDYDMANGIAFDIDRKIASGVKPSEIVILYRTNYASKVLEEALRALHIKYKVIGGQSFYNRKEIKACLAILRLMCNPDDRVAFDRTIESCCRGIGERTVSHLIEHCVENKMTIISAAQQYSLQNGIQPKIMHDFLTTFNTLKQLPAPQALSEMVNKTLFGQRMKAESTLENDRVANIKEMIEDVTKYYNENQNASLSGYLQLISLLSSADEDADDNEVKLMTLHACKGLEFDHVYLSHLCNKILPHNRCISVQDHDERAKQIEEERRLFYVGMTRTKKSLVICFFQFKKENGRESEYGPSPFLYETGLRVPNMKLHDSCKSYKKNYDDDE